MMTTSECSIVAFIVIFTHCNIHRCYNECWKLKLECDYFMQGKQNGILLKWEWEGLMG